jgi:hypothetical protein
MGLVIVACVPNKRFGKSGGRPMVTQIEVREFPPTAKVSKAKPVKSSSDSLTVAQKKFLKRKYKEAEALRGSVSSAWGRQAISALKNRSTLPLNVPNPREGVRRQAGIERKRQSDVEGGKLTSAKARAAWHEPFLQPQAILIATAFLACFAMVAGVRPGSRAVTAAMSDPPPIMAALRVEALEAEFASKVEAAPADTGKAGTIFTATAGAVELTAASQADGPTPKVEANPVPHLAAVADAVELTARSQADWPVPEVEAKPVPHLAAVADAVELTARSQADGPVPEVEAKPVPHLGSANFVGAASSAASSPTPPAANAPIQVARVGGQIKPTYAGMWGADQSACSTRNRKRLLPTMIDTDGARAGETFCRFKKKQETQSGWNVIANCSNGRERWVANVRLKVQGERLTWSSERGSQAYVRCEPGMTVAQAN